ncbi:MAG: hypothetical protein AAGJ82_05345, partial [Bacteroidota bacterium]
MSSYCDNLIPNAGFETFITLPDDDCDWALATGWTNAATTNNCNTSNGTPDYYHVNGTGPFSDLSSNYFADVPTFEGNAAMGIAMYSNLLSDFREYVSISLDCPLVVGETYTFSFALTLGSVNVGAYAVNNMGALFSVGAVNQPPGTNAPIAATPQINVSTVVNSSTWQTFSFTFVADQAYTQMTFGNFSDDSELTIVPVNSPSSFAFAYYFVDDFSLTGNDSPPVEVDLGADRSICQGETTTLVAPDLGANTTYLWSTGATTSTIEVGNNDTYSVTVTTDCGMDDDAIEVSVLPTETQSETASFCAGGSYELNGEVYTAAGTYTQLIPGGGSNGCDLEITLSLTEDALETQSETASFCTGGSYELNGEVYTAAGTYTQVIPGGGSNGCDLEITLNLTEDAIETQSETASFCAGGSYELNGEVYTAAGTYTQVVPGGGSNGCDLEITLSLTEDAIETQSETASFCAGGSYELNGEVYTAAGTYTQLIPGGGSNGCDLEITLS